jgi:hypothetical protein
MQCHLCAVTVKKLSFTGNGEGPMITRDNKHYIYINNIFYSLIKYISSEHISVILFLWIYSKHEV